MSLTFNMWICAVIIIVVINIIRGRSNVLIRFGKIGRRSSDSSKVLETTIPIGRRFGRGQRHPPIKRLIGITTTNSTTTSRRWRRRRYIRRRCRRRFLLAISMTRRIQGIIFNREALITTILILIPIRLGMVMISRRRFDHTRGRFLTTRVECVSSDPRVLWMFGFRGGSLAFR